MNSNPEIALSPDDILGEFAGFSDSLDAGAWLRGRPHLLRREVVEILAEAVRQRVRVDVDDAMRLAEAALALAAILGDPASLGRGCRAKANAL